MFSNLAGWHLVVLLVILLLVVVAIAAVALIVRALALRGAPRSSDIGARVRALDRLRDEGLVSDTEYQAKRAEILAGI